MVRVAIISLLTLAVSAYAALDPSESQNGKTGYGFVGGNGGNAGNNGGSAGNGGNKGVATGDGAKNNGTEVGTQFITGPCSSDAVCASTCCSKTTKACAAIGAVGIEDCGFVAESNGTENSGNGVGTQFITGACSSDAVCASTCCSKTTKACAAIGAVGIEDCGFVAESNGTVTGDNN